MKLFWQGQSRQLVLRAVLVLLILVLSAGAVLAYLGTEAHLMKTSTEIPSLVLAGQPFDFYVVLQNVSDDSQQIVSLGFDIEGIKVLETVPNFRRTADGKRWTETVFSRQQRPQALPGNSLRLRVRAVAAEPGNYRGEVTIWYNNKLQSDSVVLTITAVPNPLPWLGH
jgi:hypothetical protein